MSSRLRWGILGTGNIARQFATGVNAALRSELVAVGSRTPQTANAFGTTHRIASAYGDYQAVLADARVEAVYVSLPNSMHHEWTIKALQAGKHVLCEKPLASNAAQAQEMFAAAQAGGRVLMEAFMYRSHPLTAAVLRSIAEGAIGDVRLIRTSFCYRTTRIHDNIRFRADLAGGALMDVGCYCTDFCRMIAGAEPVAALACGHLHEGGVDDLAGGTLLFPGGVVGSFVCGMTAQADNTAAICGSEGFIEIPIPWKPPAENAVYSIVRATPPRMDQPQRPVTAPPPPPRQSFTVSAGRDLYALEADDFAAAIQDHLPTRLSPADTIGNMQLLDQLRNQVGVRQ